MRKQPIGLMLALMVVGCDPIFSLRVQQTFWPAPRTSCLDSALLASPHIVRAARISEAKGVTTYAITLTDSITKWYQPKLEIAQPTKSDPGVAVRVRYFWALSSRLAAPMEQRVAQRGAEVLEDLRRACAPSAGPEIDCMYTGGFAASGECRAAHLTGR